MMPTDRHEQALRQYRQRAAGYDRSFSIVIAGPVRRGAVRRLAPRAGETIIDVACGTGLNFARILAALGPTGSLVGVEMSPEMLAVARDRVSAHGWGNVELIEGPAEEMQPPRPVDAALLSFTHDVLQNEAAMARVALALRPGGRAVAAGVMYPWPAPARPLVRAAARPYVTTTEGLERPWRLLAEHLEIATIERLRLYAGSMYVVSARKRG